MLTCESSTVTRSHIGKHFCLYCTIVKDHLRVPLAERGPFPARTIETLESDHASFMASGGNLKNAKHFNNAIGSAFFKIPLTQASLKIIICTTFLHGNPQVCPPALHITLGVFYSLFTLFERECHQLDLTTALHTSSAPGPALESFRSYSKALQEVHRITDLIEEERSGLNGLQQLVSYLTISLTSTQAAQAMQCLHQQLVTKRERIKQLVYTTYRCLYALLHKILLGERETET